MSKKQTRRSLSLSRAMYEAVKLRAASLGKSASQYMHDLAAREMAAAGVTAPAHVSPHEPHNVRAQKHDWNATATDEAAQARLAALRRQEIDEIAEARRLAAGRTGRSVFRERVHDSEDAVVIEAKLAGHEPPPVADGCAWCGEAFNARGAAIHRQRVETADGPHHRKCLEERMRVERRTAVRT